MLTLVFVSVSLVVLGGIGRWSLSSSAITARNNSFNSSVAAAEAATEVVLGQMNRDFLRQSLASNPEVYNSVLPGTMVPNDWPSSYRFSDGHGNPDRTDVLCTGWQQWTNVDSGSGGLYGMINTYQITSNARQLAGLYPVAAGVRQNVQFTAVPLYQFAIFYSMDLEINPAPPMVVTGKTYSNGNIYTAPSSTLEFVDTVSAAGHVYNQRSTNDPSGGNKTVPIFDKGYVNQAPSLTLPVGIDNNPTNVVQILDPPPAGEDPASLLGRQRFYNKCDLVITTTNNQVTVQYNDYADGTAYELVPTNNIDTGYSFIKTNASFYDYREGRQVLATEIDVQALSSWMAGSRGLPVNLLVQSRTKHQINSIYVNDQRSIPGTLTAVRVINGQTLPAGGLTVATPLPLYVKGNYNAPDLTVGSTNTTQTAPASLVGDAITILSPNWNDNNGASSASLSARTAANTTVNAALLSGIVPSVTVNGQAHYSGGVENFTRFLENWNGSALTYNGSMVVMFPSRYATHYWIAPGTYYNPPTRDWAFDQNFMNPDKLPPVTPQARTLQRTAWTTVAAANN
jgi:hypothetical protein